MFWRRAFWTRPAFLIVASIGLLVSLPFVARAGYRELESQLPASIGLMPMMMGLPWWQLWMGLFALAFVATTLFLSPISPWLADRASALPTAGRHARQ